MRAYTHTQPLDLYQMTVRLQTLQMGFSGFLPDIDPDLTSYPLYVISKDILKKNNTKYKAGL